MKQNLLKKMLLWVGLIPNSRFIAKQLTQPFGSKAEKFGKLMNKANDKLYKNIIDILEIKDGEEILEIGFANGRFFEKLFKKNKNIKVSGVDYSEPMVKIAREYNEDLIEDNKLDLYYCSSNAMPFESKKFDKIFCINLIYFWENAEENLQEIFRVLKPGGKFYACFRLKDCLNKLPYTRYWTNLYEVDDWISILEKNNFTDINKIIINEHQVEMMGHKVQLKSCCTIAERV
ncbi:MAG: methyltransferase domain-containing protein [Bacteroidetes bacterium]|nr:methyltransferase domain-containing protein [Bacteroidota bacterium]